MTRTPLLGRATFVALLLAAAIAATWANSDLRAGRPFLYMDEIVVFDGVKQILTASDGETFRFAVFDGGDHRYGRILYNVSALFAWGPHRLWGDPGLILAVRSVQAAAFLAAAALLCLTFIRSWGWRCAALASIVCLPFTDYFLTQPKPEPLQLLFYAVFLAFAVRRHFAFGWHWMFLGLAFGTKISAAPLCAVAVGAAWWMAWLQEVPRFQVYRQALAAGGCFLAGWIIAVPILAVPTGGHLNLYLHGTFLGTGHGADDAGVSLLDWLRESFGGATVRGYFPAWAAALAGAAALLLLAISFRERRVARAATRARLEKLDTWILLAMAAALIVPIMLAVKRLWGLYLLPGQVLGVVALASLAAEATSPLQPENFPGKLRRGAALATGLMLVVVAGVSTPAIAAEYHRLATRTSSEPFRRNLTVYRVATTLLARIAGEAHEHGASGPLLVSYDPNLFVPDPTPAYMVRPYWGPFREWRTQPHAIVMGRRPQLAGFLGETPPPPPSSAEHAAFTAARAAFAEYVALPTETATAKPYHFATWLTDDAALILRADIFQLCSPHSQPPVGSRSSSP